MVDDNLIHNTLPAVVGRREVYHSRKIEANGYKRTDGLWDIEAWLKDSKGYDFENFDRGKIRTGDPLHEMRLRLTMNDDMEIVDAHAVINGSPYGLCHQVTPNYFKKLVGLKVVAGFTKEIKNMFRGVMGCTHLTDMLAVMATVAYQTIINAKLRQAGGTMGLQKLVNNCYGFGEGNDVVAHYKKQWHSDGGSS